MNRILRSSKAALDLASIMVGVVVIGIIGGVIGATVFAVVPWAQDEIAKQQLQEISSAQQAYAGSKLEQQVLGSLTATQVTPAATGVTDSYGDLSELVSAGYFTIDLAAGSTTTSLDGDLCVVTTDAAAHYRSEARSDTGTVFYITDEMNGTERLPDGEEPTCLPEVVIPSGGGGGGGPVTPPVALETYDNICDGTYCTFGTYKGSYAGFRMLLDDWTIPTTSDTPVDWEFRIDRTGFPYSLLSDAEIISGTVTDGGAAIRLDGNDIVVYNTESYRRVSTTQPLPSSFTVWFDYVENTPHYGHTEVTNGGPQNLLVSAQYVYADVTLSLVDVNEPIFGTWSTRVDVSNMLAALPQNGTVTLNQTYIDDGVTLNHISGNIYELVYDPDPAVVAEWSRGLKGAAIVNPVNYTAGAISMPSALIFTGDGVVVPSVTLTAAGAPTNIYWPNQVWNIPEVPAGSWSTTVDLAALQAFSGRTNASITAGSFTISRIGTTSQYTVSFTGTWDVNASTPNITIVMLS